jgi:MarR family transcriptional regulator, organic hydroperoxide resistance regulator
MNHSAVVQHRQPRRKPRTRVDDILDEFGFWMSHGRRQMARHWCSQDLSLTHVHALLLLAQGQLSMSHLADALGVSLPNATGIVGRMAERGLVERVHDEIDRRVVHVRLSERGRAALEEAEATRRERFGAIVAALTPEQQERTLQALRDLRVAAEGTGFTNQID